MPGEACLVYHEVTPQAISSLSARRCTKASRRCFRSHRATPREFAQVVMACLARDPRRRPWLRDRGDGRARARCRGAGP